MPREMISSAPEPTEEEPVEQAAEVAEQPKGRGREPLSIPQPPMVPKTTSEGEEATDQTHYLQELQRGFQRSTYSEIKRHGEEKNLVLDFTGGYPHLKEVPPETRQYLDEVADYPTGFFEKLVGASGEMVGDVPFIALGSAMTGTMTFLATGNPFLATAFGAGGGLALNGFLKESFRQYRQFQESGGDLTYGEFLDRASEVANHTLKEGVMGTLLGTVKYAMPILRNVPIFDNLFNTRYVGKAAQIGADVLAETATAIGTTAALEGRLPDAEDAAMALVLFSAGKLSELPSNAADAIRTQRSAKFNIALGDQVEKLNLAYPPIQEFKVGENPVYKNSVELDRNLTAFDRSYIENIVSMIDSLSPTDFSSSHEAGSTMKKALELTQPQPVQPAVPTPITSKQPPPVKPKKRAVPLVQNPLRQAVQTISPERPLAQASLGRRINEVYHQNREAEYQPLRERYDAIEENLDGINTTNAPRPLLGEVIDFIEEFEGSAAPDSQETRILSGARRLRNRMATFDNEGNVTGELVLPLNDLIKTNRSLKQIPNWEVPPEMKDNITRLTQNIDAYIGEQINQQAPAELANEYFNLNADYHNFKQRYDNSEMGVFYKRTHQEQAIVDKFTKLDDFSDISEALDGSPEGRRVLNMLRREAWTKGLGEDALNARTEGDFAKAIEKLNDNNYANLMQYLTPEQREIALSAMRDANQVRQSVAQSEAAFTREQQSYQAQMDAWKAKNKSEGNNAKMAKQVQTKQDLLVSLLEQNPANIYGKMNSIEGIQQVKEITKKIAGGKELYESLARFQTERLFDFMQEGYIRTGRAPYTDLKLKMTNKEFRAKLKELNGDQFVKDIDQLVDVAENLSKNFKETQVKFKDDPATMDNVLRIYSILGLMDGKIFTPLMTYTAKKNLLKMGGKAADMWANRRNYDPKYIHEVLEAARAVQGGNKQKIRHKASLLMPINPERPRTPSK